MSVLRVTAYLSSAIATRDVIHLDTILAACHPNCVGGGLTRSHGGVEINYPSLPIARLAVGGEWVYAATAELYPDGARRGQEHFVKRKDDADIEARAKAWTPNTGPERTYMLPVPTIETPVVSWLAVGCRRGLRKLIRRAGNVGMLRRQGYGVVARWEVELAGDVPPERILIGADGLLARHLPSAWCEPGATVDSGRWLPPYWHPDGSSRVRARTRAAVRPEALQAAARLS